MIQCSAKSKRSGERCKKPAMSGKNVCRMHGGATRDGGAPVGSQNALVHGVYSRRVSIEEFAIWNEIDLKSLDDEIRISKLQLRRALIAQRESEDALQAGNELKGLELAEIEEQTGGEMHTKTVKRKRPDWWVITDRLLARIGKLVAIRDTIVKGRDFDGDIVIKVTHTERDGE